MKLVGPYLDFSMIYDPTAPFAPSPILQQCELDYDNDTISQ